MQGLINERARPEADTGGTEKSLTTPQRNRAHGRSFGALVIENSRFSGAARRLSEKMCEP